LLAVYEKRALAGVGDSWSPSTTGRVQVRDGQKQNLVFAHPVKREECLLVEVGVRVIEVPPGKRR
jgi:hypothetical protein